MFETVYRGYSASITRTSTLFLFYAEVLPIRRKTLSNQSINQSIYLSFLPRQQNKADLFPLKVTKYVGL